MKTIGLISLIYIIYALGSTYSYSLYQIKNKTQKSIQSEANISLDELTQEVSMNKQVGITSELADGLALRGELIDKAQSTLYLAQYKIEKDESGLYIIKKIEEAAKRGVKVKILINGLSNNKGKSSYFTVLDPYENVEIKIVGGINFLVPWEINNVLHDKLILVDDTYLMSSGRNVSNRFMLPSNSETLTEDMDLVIKKNGSLTPNSLIEQGRRYYEKLWNSDYAKRKRRYKSFSKDKLNKLESQNKEMMNTYSYLFEKSRLETMNFSKVSNGLLVYNETNSIVKKPNIWKQITTFINQSDKEIRIMSPYIVITNRMLSFMDIRNSGQTNMYTNSATSSPNVLAFGGYLNQKNKLLNSLDIWEFQSTNSIHQKAISIDEDVIGVGSFNIDSRSTYFSSENMLFINSPDANQELNKIIKDYENNSLKADGLFNYEDNNENTNTLGTFKKGLLTLISWVSPLFRIFL